MAGITPIENVPQSPNTTVDPTYLYNPMNEDYVFVHGGKEYVVPAKSKKLFPEVRAYHGAKHLAKKIAYEETLSGIRKIEVDDKDPEKWKKVSQSVPNRRVQELMVSFISYPDSVIEEVEKVEEPISELLTGLEEEPEEKSIDEVSFKDLQKLAKEKGVAKFGATRKELIEALR